MGWGGAAGDGEERRGGERREEKRRGEERRGEEGRGEERLLARGCWGGVRSACQQLLEEV